MNTKNMKTVKEWFEGVEDPGVMWFLLERMNRDFNESTPTLNRAIMSGISWIRTKEGACFWHECYHSPDPIAYLRAHLDSQKQAHLDSQENPDTPAPYYGPKDTPYEVHKFISAHNLNFNRGCVVKYAVRAGRKDPKKEIEDLNKAIDYLKFEIERLKENT